MLSKAFIPYKGYYSSPFVRWQGAFANDNAIVLSADTSKKWFQYKNFDPNIIDFFIYGTSVHQKHGFWANTWAPALMGAEHITGTTIYQACTTSATAIYHAAMGVELNEYKIPYCLISDRISNSPHTVWPNPKGKGGKVETEDWVMDNFNKDPWAGQSMIQTADNMARKGNITKEQLDECTVLRHEQYKKSLENNREFQKKYMFPVGSIDNDNGDGKQKTRNITEKFLRRLKPVLPNGIHTQAHETYPADGHCGIIVTTKDMAKELSNDPSISIQIISYGYARVEKALMPAAAVPATKMALDKANIGIDDIKVTKHHNAFVSNDIYLAQETGLNLSTMNNYGSSLIYGHPQSPVLARSMIEGIEELVLLGGGYLLVAGGAAGDSGVAIILKVS